MIEQVIVKDDDDDDDEGKDDLANRHAALSSDNAHGCASSSTTKFLEKSVSPPSALSGGQLQSNAKTFERATRRVDVAIAVPRNDFRRWDS